HREQALIARVKPRGSDRRAFEATRLDGRAAEDLANLAERGRKLLLGPAGEQSEGIVGSRIVVAVARERFEQLLAEGLSWLEVADPPLVAELGQLGRLGDRVAHSAEAVDEPELPRGATVPHAALGNLVDIGRRPVPRGSDDRQ